MSRARTGVLLPLLPGGSQGRAFPPCGRGKAEFSGHPNCKGRDAARSQDRRIPGQHPVQLDQAEGQGWGSGQAAPGLGKRPRVRASCRSLAGKRGIFKPVIMVMTTVDLRPKMEKLVPCWVGGMMEGTSASGWSGAGSSILALGRRCETNRAEDQTWRDQSLRKPSNIGPGTPDRVLSVPEPCRPALGTVLV